MGAGLPFKHGLHVFFLNWVPCVWNYYLLKKGKNVPKPNSRIYTLIFSLWDEDNSSAQECSAVWETSYRTTAARQRSWIPSLWENKDFLELVSAQIEQKIQRKNKHNKPPNPQMLETCWIYYQSSKITKKISFIQPQRSPVMLVPGQMSPGHPWPTAPEFQGGPAKPSHEATLPFFLRKFPVSSNNSSCESTPWSWRAEIIWKCGVIRACCCHQDHPEQGLCVVLIC